MNSAETISSSINISGYVQGVGYRYSANRVAKIHGVKGYVKNLPDGSVFIHAEGTQQQINALVKWCHEGPSNSVVRNVQVSPAELQNFKEFSIKYP